MSDEMNELCKNLISFDEAYMAASESDPKFHDLRYQRDYEAGKNIKEVCEWALSLKAASDYDHKEYKRMRDEIVANYKAEITTLQHQLTQATKALEFYANPENWTKSHQGLTSDVIDYKDCADYPHITRDVRLTGGKLARQTLASLKTEGVADET